MKRAFPIFLVILSVILSACAASPTQSPPLPVIIVTAVMDTAQPVLTPTSAVEVSTSIPVPTETSTPQSIVVAIPTSTDSTDAIPDVQNPASYPITLNDNGKTFNLRVGDSILLDLGADMYKWDVIVDNQSVISLRMGMTVTQGAQGIFDAHAPGTATLIAAGDPQCRTSTPPCMMPSILFKITVVVQ